MPAIMALSRAAPGATAMSNAARQIDQDEYDAIHEAVLSTPKGRWFLDEYARRHSATDTQEVMDAITRLYDMARETAAEARFGFLYHEMQEMRRAMGETRAAISAVKPGTGVSAAPQGELVAVADAANRAAEDTRHAAERLQEIVEILRHAGIDADLCDEIETHASGIFMASSYQEMTGRRIGLVVQALETMERHITKVIALWETEARKD